MSQERLTLAERLEAHRALGISLFHLGFTEP